VGAGGYLNGGEGGSRGWGGGGNEGIHEVVCFEAGGGGSGGANWLLHDEEVRSGAADIWGGKVFTKRSFKGLIDVTPA